MYIIVGAAYRLECVYGTVWPADTITPTHLDDGMIYTQYMYTNTLLTHVDLTQIILSVLVF